MGTVRGYSDGGFRHQERVIRPAMTGQKIDVTNNRFRRGGAERIRLPETELGGFLKLNFFVGVIGMFRPPDI